MPLLPDTAASCFPLLARHLHTPDHHCHHLVAASSTTSGVPLPAITFLDHSLSVQSPPPSSLTFFQSFSSRAPPIVPFLSSLSWATVVATSPATDSTPPIDLILVISILFHSYLAEPHRYPSWFCYSQSARPSGWTSSFLPSPLHQTLFLLPPHPLAEIFPYTLAKFWWYSLVVYCRRGRPVAGRLDATLDRHP